MNYSKLKREDLDWAVSRTSEDDYWIDGKHIKHYVDGRDIYYYVGKRDGRAYSTLLQAAKDWRNN